ncbi:MAG: anion permease [Proteobacteria bacterium]|nr:anion permease [Pseudomonadota bacterium]
MNLQATAPKEGVQDESNKRPARELLWRWGIPVVVAVVLASIPAPTGLKENAWHFFALFAGIVAALVLEPIPPAATGVVAITLGALLSRWTLFSPDELANPKFKAASETVKWAFSGFASNTVWLVGGAFMFALAYEKTGLGKRIALLLVRLLGKNSLSLGYAAVFADTALAPFTPSNTARSAGTMFPIFVNLPPIYNSLPNDPSARRIGGYLLWTTFAASCVTSSLFMTACAPNFLAIDFIRKIAHVNLTYGQWFMAAAPFAIPLLLLLPLIGYVVCPPELRKSPEIPKWARERLVEMGPLSRNEIILAALVLLAIVLWVTAGDYIDAAIVAFMVISALLVLGVIKWSDMARNHAAWTTIVLLATLVAMAEGLSKTGFIKWFADYVGSHVNGLPPGTVLMVLITVYFFSHYFFSSLTAHTSAMMPIMLGVGMAVPGLEPEKLALGLALTTGLMGVISPYATGAALPYYNSGYITSVEFWRNGTVYGIIFLAALLFVGLPFL